MARYDTRIMREAHASQGRERVHKLIWTVIPGTIGAAADGRPGGHQVCSKCGSGCQQAR
jgi:hypothetical protein